MLFIPANLYEHYTSSFFIISTIIFIKTNVCNEFYEQESPRLKPWGMLLCCWNEQADLCTSIYFIVSKKSTPGISTITAVGETGATTTPLYGSIEKAFGAAAGCVLIFTANITY